MRKNSFTQEEIDIILNKPKEENWTEYLTRINYTGKRSQSCLATKAYKLGFRSIHGSSRKYIFNEDFWETPNEINSYYAGWIASDGNIIKNPKTKDKYILKLELQKKDRYIIENFVESCEYTGKIKNCRGNSYAKINCGSKWPKDLKRNFNITPRKTLTLKPPNLHCDKLIKCYLKGFIDGDGHIGHSFNKKWETIFIKTKCASKEFIYWFHEYLNNFSKHANHQKRSRKGIYKSLYEKTNIITYDSRFVGYQAAFIIDEFNKLDLPHLKRKWEKPEVINFLKKAKEKHPDKFNLSLDN